ncbi:MAG: hypothetical protein H6710_14315 [Myxococcales bacterium]|nr:hypothetical protein [Myxococcales bacterium]MCB9705085.1 hypothetical protein [Myxococcales bacterium]
MSRIVTRLPALVFAGLLGLGLGASCKSSSGGGSSSPGATSVQGSPACPRSVPRSGTSCPRGQVDFCVYRGGGPDQVCTCGKSWTCAKK